MYVYVIFYCWKHSAFKALDFWKEQNASACENDIIFSKKWAKLKYFSTNAPKCRNIWAYLSANTEIRMSSFSWNVHFIILYPKFSLPNIMSLLTENIFIKWVATVAKSHVKQLMLYNLNALRNLKHTFICGSFL